MRLTTLCYPMRDGQVLLAMKKRGFGVGKWNGPGGKVELGEEPHEACKRETFEETGLRILELEARGTIEFVFIENPEWNNRCFIYTASVEGEPMETEEMCPQWYSLESVPYTEMWSDDPIWLPNVLAGGRVSHRFFFDASGNVVRHELLEESPSRTIAA